ncbi:hypothetical protein RhiirC2_223909 [Rhizophagus irregularis]|uniref:K Homology domain-containing protein n=1 Tax=Rhizophagus irregularis TaxID=588596 RepID=A0A2N1MHS5_9GLOM|nr:hypothetical protein RhiirC2_223909 [Rhizophagus irregularis]
MLISSKNCYRRWIKFMNILPKNTLYYVLLDNQMKHVTSGITAWMFWSRLTRVPTSSISHIIGKGGANIKDIQNRSGAKCKLQGNYVVITGSSDSQRILEAIIALRQPLIGLKSVKFVKYQGIVDEYNVNKAYFVLDKGEEMSQIDKDNNISSMKSLNRVSDIVIPEEDSTLVIHITKRLIEEMNKYDKFLLKVQTNIGKQLFYPAKKGVVNLPTCVPLEHFAKYKIGNKADAKATFMNRLPLDIAEVIEGHLKKLGYEEDNTTKRASIHLIDVKEKQRITISSDITPEGHLKLRKCRSDNISHLFLSFVRPKSTLDFRFKVLSHKGPMNDIPSTICHIIDNSSYNFDAKAIVLPNITDNTEYRVTTTRTKFKRKFISNNTGNKVTISNVYETGKVDVQVTVTNLGLHEVLAKMKNQETSTNQRELEEELEKKVEKFVDEMNRIVDGVQWNG